MKIVHIKDLKWVKAILSCASGLTTQGRLYKVTNYGTNRTGTYIDFLDNKGGDNMRTYVGMSNSIIPVDEQGNGIILIID